MKYLILILLPSMLSAQLPADKQKHYFAGAMVGSWGTMLTINEKPLKSFAISLAPVVLLGASKEVVYDKWMGQGTPEWKDFGWTVIGGATGYAGVRMFKWICEKIDKRKNKVYAH